MSSWIRIKNKKTVHRLFLEIIGLGTKQKGDRKKIGQWASGFKLATPAALRLGIEVVATSTDTIGPFILRFDTKEIDIEYGGESVKEKIISYHYNDGRTIYAPVALAAFRGWAHGIGDDDNPLYPILREYIANARDEDRQFTWDAGITEVLQAEPGMSAVYVQETPEALDILSTNSNRYFKFFGELPLFRVVSIGGIYAKSSPKETRRFNDGYLVDCVREDFFNKSLFDYDGYGKDLVNELRTIESSDKFYRRLAKLFIRIKDKDLLRQLITFACVNNSAIEREIFSRIEEDDMSDLFKEMCRKIFEENDSSDVLLSHSNESYDSYMRTLGYKVVSYGHEMNGFFEKVGVKNSRVAYEERLKNIKLRDLDSAECVRVASVIRKYLWRIKNYTELIEKCPIGAMDDPALKNRGLCTNNFSTIYLSKDIFSDDDIDFLGTLCHELDHYETKLRDSDYIKLMRHKDRRNARNLILLSIALKALEDMGVDISTLHPEFITIEKSK